MRGPYRVLHVPADTQGWTVRNTTLGLQYRAPDGTTYREVRQEARGRPDLLFHYRSGRVRWLRRVGYAQGAA